MSSATPMLMLLLLMISSIQSQGANVCLLNREDRVPCLDHFNSGIISPGPNQYTIHATHILPGKDGLPICIKIKKDEIIRDIQDLGSPDVKFLFSPGAEQKPRMNYTNQLLVEYNVQCQAGKTAFIMFETLDLEPANCKDGTQLRCQDYVEIDAGAGRGRMEYCGNVVPAQPFIVGTGKFTLKFRSSFFNSYPGFRVFVTCFSGEESIQNNACTKSEESKMVEVIDLTKNLRSRRAAKSLPMSLTSEEIRTVDQLAESLFTVALSQVRHNVTNWPPASYLQNKPGDILDLNDLALSIAPQPPPAARRRRRLRTRQVKEPANLDSGTTMEAVRNANACNPIVRSVAQGFIGIAKRIDPDRLKEAQQQLKQ